MTSTTHENGDGRPFQDPSTTSRRTGSRRTLEWIGLVAGGFVAVLVVVLILLSFSGVRESLLSFGLSRVSSVLPGDLRVGRATWPSAGAIEITDIQWIDDTDTLLAAEQLSLSIDILPLIKRDVVIESIIAREIDIDIPAITKRFPPARGEPATTGESSRPDFPREGSLPGLPSFAVGRLVVTSPSIRLDDARVITGIVIDGSCDFTTNASPRMSLNDLTVRGPDDAWGIDSLVLDLDLAEGRAQGRGAGRLSPDIPLLLSIGSDAPDSVSIIITGAATARSPDAPGLDIRARLERRGLTVESIRFDARITTPHTSDLSRVPRLAAHVETLPELDGITLTARGSLQMHPELAARVTCDIGENSWIKQGHAVITYDTNALSMDDVSLELTDLSLDAVARVTADSVLATAEVRLDGPRSLSVLRPGLDLPAGLVVDVAANVALSRSHREMIAAIDASGRTESFAIDRLLIRSNLSLDDDGLSSLTFVLRTMGLDIGFAAEIGRAHDIEVRLTPILVSNKPIDPARLRQTRAPMALITYSPTTRSIAIEDLHVSGIAGDVRLSGQVDSVLAGHYDVACLWHRPPELLVRALDLSPVQADSLRSIWPAGEAFELRIAGESTGGDSPATKTTGHFRLPGPRTLDAILPESIHLEDLGPLRGEFVIDTHTRSDGIHLDVLANLDSTGWIDSSSIHIRHGGGVTGIDTLSIATAQMIIRARGALAESGYTLDAKVEVVDSSLIQRFAPDAPNILLTAEARLAGTREQPDLEGTIEASIDGDGYQAPRVVGQFELVGCGAVVSIDAPAGLTTELVNLDSVSIDCRSMNPTAGALPARITLSVGGSDLEFFQSFVVDTVGGLDVMVDAFDLVAAGQDLRANRPFRILQRPGGLAIEDLDLAGSIGEVRIAGTLGSPATDIACDVAIAIPEQPQSLNIPEHLWPERLEVHLGAKDHDLTARALVDGFSLAHGLRSTLEVNLHGGADSIGCQVLIADEETSLLDASVVLPASVTVYPPALSLQEGPLSVDADIRAFPLAVYFLGDATEIPEDVVARVSGRITIGGTTESPTGHANVTLTFPDWPKVSVYELALEAKLGSAPNVDPSSTAAHGDLLSRAAKELGDASTSNLIAALSLRENGNSVLFGAIGHPMTLSFHPFEVSTPGGEPLRAILRSQELPCEKFDPILPSDISLEGVCKIDFTAEGPADNPALDGRFDMRDFRVSVAGQAEVLAQGAIEIGGTAAAPTVRGDITIKNGLIVVPEDMQQLHPVEGDALLLSDADSIGMSDDATTPDSLAIPSQPSEGDDIDQIDIKIAIPSQFFVRGRGLDLELAGDLNIRKTGAKPTVTGELRAIQGNLVLLGRSLRLERGTVTFLGQDEINPEFDVALSTRVGDTLIKIIVAGTAQKPRMILTSEPDMREGDIISVLLFGTTFNDLSDDQAGLVQSRATEMAAALGAAQLQKNLTGVDVVSFRGADAQDKSGTLQFGKYLSPNVLLSYVYALEDQTGSFVSLEYFLKGNFKVDTVYGRRNQTGLGFGWMKDY